jgi:ADP-heptose:LPS heptosyltransferase
MGCGDEIMASAEAREVRQANPDAKIVVGNGEREIWHEIFAGNPNITRLADVRPGDRVLWLKNYFGQRPYLDYARSDPTYRQSFRPYRALPGDFFFSDTELDHVHAVLREPRSHGKPLVSIEPNVDFGPNKDWGFLRWQQVVDVLKDRVTFVQPSYGKPLLSGVHALPSPRFRIFAAVLAGCDLHMGPEGGLHHAAAAVGCAAVVVFGGRIHPDMTGYAFHENIYRDVPGSPCGMVAPCTHCRRCLDSITVEDVVASACRLLDRQSPQRGESWARTRSRQSTTRSVDLG